MKYYKKVKGDEIFIKAIDDNNNYSIASNIDPEPDAYCDHIWKDDVADWKEVTQKEAELILGYDFD